MHWLLASLLLAYGITAAHPSDFLPSTMELVTGWGLECTRYQVLTEDGYFLDLHRLGKEQGPPVLLMHGLFSTSDTWVLRGPHQDLAFLLLEAGFDVWLGDQRGNSNSKRHVKYARSDPRFWDFSFHEAGYYDLPAFIDKILEVRQAPKLYYIGHSLGTCVFLVMSSTRPEYNQKVYAAVFLSPVGLAPPFEEFSSTPVREAALRQAQLWKRYSSLGLYEMFPRSKRTFSLLQWFCSHKSPLQDLCLDLIGNYAGEHRANLDRNKLPRTLASTISGSSTKTVFHLFQLFRSGEFKQFDYGARQNVRRYNSTKPPNYQLDRVIVPIAIFYGHNDALSPKKAADRLAEALPNLIVEEAVPDPNFTHIDMVLGINAKDILYPQIVEILVNIRNQITYS